jgi:hypothetical protein
MKTTHLLGIALIGLGAYIYLKNRPKAQATAKKEGEGQANAIGYNTIPEREKMKNATGFDVPSSGKNIYSIRRNLIYVSSIRFFKKGKGVLVITN